MSLTTSPAGAFDLARRALATVGLFRGRGTERILSWGHAAHVSRRPGRPPKERDAALVRRLERLAADYERKVSRLDSERHKLKASRDERIRGAASDGLPEVEIARIFGLSQQYVNRLLHR